MVKNVYRKEGTNEYFVGKAKEGKDEDFIMKNRFICSFSNFAIVSRSGKGYIFLVDIPIEIAGAEIKLDNELVRIFDADGEEIADFYADRLFLNYGCEMSMVTQYCSNNFSMKKDFVIAI